MQPTKLTVTGSAQSPLLTLSFYPCPGQAISCATGNNGNLQSQIIAPPGLSLTQTYTYDHLNRLTGASETGGAGWAQNYGYDALGNRWVTANTNLPDLTLETPVAQSWYSTTVPNRIATWSYDAAGNVLQVGGMTRNFTYDAENRQVTANLYGAISSYQYDGNGLRVSRTTGGQTTTYVYDAWGNVASEYSNTTEASPCGTPTCYVTQDHLGSTRMLTDNVGSSVVRRYDYQPFGQEILAGYDGRLASMGYLAMVDDTNPKFTGQQRDVETGLDWFQVRHMSGAAGRFQSPDPPS